MYTSVFFKIFSVTSVHAQASVIFLWFFCNNYASNTYTSICIDKYLYN